MPSIVIVIVKYFLIGIGLAYIIFELSLLFSKDGLAVIGKDIGQNKGDLSGPQKRLFRIHRFLTILAVLSLVILFFLRHIFILI